MKPGLLVALLATLVLTGALALWPMPPAEVPATVALRTPAAAPQRAPVNGPPAAAAALAARHRASAPAPAPAPAPATAPAAPAPGLPTRAADWPAPAPAALAAWQGALPPARPAPSAAAPPRAAPAAEAAASAGAPAFPYRWIGQLDDGAGAPQMLLASAQRSVGVRLGATLDGRWRLLRGADGLLLAQALPEGAAQPVPGAPLLLP